MGALIKDDVSEQIAALMIIVGALAKKSELDLDELQAFADHALNTLDDEDAQAIRNRLGTWLETYGAVAESYDAAS